jgi:hypothetical protein
VSCPRNKRYTSYFGDRTLAWRRPISRIFGK